ncbi:MAG: pyridoxal phosphate-dependent aminotransferase [Muribaculaceae bacterium]|nr:pyridoxal phosphate-dependent aminotransferase [Muribaculaceae bacterium]
MNYDFDRIIDRRGTCAVKYDGISSRFGCDHAIPLWVADMDFAVCPEILEALHHRLEHPVLGYPETPDSYWQSITGWLQRRHGLEIRREEITFVPGVVRGIALAVNYFTRENDGIVIQPPVYHPFRQVIEGNRRTVIENPLILDDDTLHYRMDLDGLENILSERQPKMLILCNPHNPGGIQWDYNTLRRLAELCRQHHVTVVSDEIHGDLMLRGGRHLPFATVSDDAAAVAITLGAPSKTFNIPGMVSSWYFIKNPKLRTPFYNWLQANEFDSPTMMATIATKAAYNHGEAWLDALLDYIQGNIDMVEEFFASRLPEIRPMRPDASFLVWLDCRRLGFSQPELVDRFLHKAGLALNQALIHNSAPPGPD